MIPWLLAGCAASLLPGEAVLGEDVAAVAVTGEAGAALGTRLALGPEGLLATAPGLGEVWGIDADGAVRWRWAVAPAGGLLDAWWGPEGAEALVRGEGIFRRDPDAEGPGERVRALDETWTAAAPCPDGSVALAEGAGSAVACGEAGELRSTCAEGSCAVSLRDPATGEEVVLDETTPGSAVGFRGDGTACWGDVRAEEPTWTGEVRCADGLVLSGAEGEHLGVALAGDRAAGWFDKWIVPARARALDLGGGEAWVVDRAAERSRLALASGDGLWAVGAPGWMGHDAWTGRVWILEAP